MTISNIFKQVTAQQILQTPQTQLFNIATTNQSNENISTISMNSSFHYSHEIAQGIQPPSSQRIGIDVTQILREFENRIDSLDTAEGSRHLFNVTEIRIGERAEIRITPGKHLPYREIQYQDVEVIKLLSKRNLNPNDYVIVKAMDEKNQQAFFCLLTKVELSRFPSDIFFIDNDLPYIK